MENDHTSMDGFVVRRRAQQGHVGPRPPVDTGKTLPSQYLIDPTKRQVNVPARGVPVVTRPGTKILSEHKDLSLPAPRQKQIDIDLTLDERPSRAPKAVRKKRPTKKIVKRVALGLIALLIIAGGYFGYKIFSTSGKVFSGNPITALFSKAKPLKVDANGQSNILLFGTSEDDPGHPGANLTDSIMLVSVNQTRKDAFVVSVPRDLYVDYGKACNSGYKGKINEVYGCASGAGEEAGAAALRQKVGEIFGMDVQYSSHVNYTVLRQAVDAVGGITVTIESKDPRGILDRNFDWDCPKGVFSCYNVKYPNGPANLDGKHALYLARARGDDNGQATYGLSRSNPDRQDNQRKILIALKDKAVSAGVLTNPISVNNLLDAIGNNLRTNFEADEIKTLVDLGKNVPSASITSWSLEDPERPLATASCSGSVCPNKGTFVYTDIQKVAAALSTGDIASLENAKADVLNASGTPGLAQTKAAELTAKNITVGLVGNAPQSLGTKPIQFYDQSGGKKPGTLKKLETLLGVTATAGKPAGVSSAADFVIIIGVQPAPAATTPAQ